MAHDDETQEDPETGAELSGGDFTDAVLADQFWSTRSYERCLFIDADLSGARTSGIKLDEADLRGARVDAGLRIDPAE